MNVKYCMKQQSLSIDVSIISDVHRNMSKGDLMEKKFTLPIYTPQHLFYYMALFRPTLRSIKGMWTTYLYFCPCFTARSHDALLETNVHVILVNYCNTVVKQ